MRNNLSLLVAVGCSAIIFAVARYLELINDPVWVCGSIVTGLLLGFLWEDE